MRRRIYKKKLRGWQARIDDIAIKILARQKYWSLVRQRILERDHHTCQQCGKKIDRFEVHHIQKKRLGGGDYDDNLITLCPKCHRKVEKWPTSF